MKLDTAADVAQTGLPKSADKDLKNAVSANNHRHFRYLRSSPIGRLGGDVP
jgi:hypothetical protein